MIQLLRNESSQGDGSRSWSPPASCASRDSASRVPARLLDQRPVRAQFNVWLRLLADLDGWHADGEVHNDGGV